MDKPRRDTTWFERWAARVCMKPICKVDDPDGEILIADSVEPIRTLGVYRTGWAINRDGMEIGNYRDYPISDFALYSVAGGVQKRVNERLEHARDIQRVLRESGYYDADGKHRFSQRPN